MQALLFNLPLFLAQADFTCGVCKCCSDKPQSKAGWLSLERQKGEVWGEISALRQKRIFKSSHLYDPKVIQHQAEYTHCAGYGEES